MARVGTSRRRSTATAPRSRSKPKGRRRSTASHALRVGKELASLRSEFREVRELLRRFGRIQLALLASIVTGSTGVPAFAQLGHIIGGFAGALRFGLT